jgi:glyoxylase-like metal-dependent hydrolase (beta-lactamase superfamily II)
MPIKTTPLTLSMPLFMGNVNCCLVETNAGFSLIDTGGSNSRKYLAAELARRGCTPGQLKLVVLTHGDADHVGNAAFLHAEFGAKIAMHPGDLDMVARGDVLAGRKNPSRSLRLLLAFSSWISPERFAPDLLLQDGDDLASYGLDARVVSIPGHTAGSIGILTSEGEFFCGDLLVNRGKPSFNHLIDDWAAAHASLLKLSSLGIHTVYPGHGQPFGLGQLGD